MPEGDTLHRIAARMQPLVGRRVVELRLRDRGAIAEAAGRTVERVHAIGKHLVIELSGDAALRVHLGMKGRWRSYRPERVPASARHAAVSLRTEGETLVCQHASQTELLRTSRLQASRALRALGPDLLAGDVSIDAVVARARDPARQATPLGELLLDQRVASGIGNVYKCETLYLCGVDPFAPVGAVGDAALRALYETAARLMRANLRPGRRVTRRADPRDPAPNAGERFWVYGRHREQCRRCRARIEVRSQGDQARATYYCPRCQGVGQTE